MTTREERLKILNLVRRGELSARQGADLLLALDGNLPLEASGAQPGEAGELSQTIPGSDLAALPPSRVDDPKEDLRLSRSWKYWWLLPLLLGTGLTLLSAWWMYLALRAGGFNIWFFCTWPVLLVGMSLTALAVQSRASPWLHVRIQDLNGTQRFRLAVSLPLPLSPVAWVLRNFGELVPSLGQIAIGDFLVAVQEALDARTPFTLEVDGDGGEKVQVSIS